MKLVSFLDDHGAGGVGAVVDDSVFPVHVGASGSPARSMTELIVASVGDPAAVRVGSAPIASLADVALQAPVPEPPKVVAAPVNYFDHKAEMNESAHINALGVFLKATSSVVGPGATVVLPYTDRRFDQEGEFALVIGRTARTVPAARALDYVFGYTCLLDMTMRGGEDRSTRKSFDTFTPMGPWLVTPDEVGDLDALRLTCSVNGVLRQDADIKDLIWGVPALIEYVSSVMTLRPGDVISTGTPAGVGEVHDGDTVSVAISRIGELTVSVSSRGAVACPTAGANRGPVPPATVTPVRVR